MSSNATSHIFSHVLFVEDDPLGQWTYTRLLEGLGCRVSKAGTCAEAKRAWETNTIDFVVTDWRLPDGQGADLIRHMRNRGRAERVICLTAEAESISDLQRSELGISAVLAKPPDIDTFETTVRQLILAGPKSATGDHRAVVEELEHVGRFTIARCPQRLCGNSAADIDKRYEDVQWLALDMRDTETIDRGTAAVLLRMAERKRSARGRLCVAGVSDDLRRGLVRQGFVDRGIDMVADIGRLESLGRRSMAMCERAALVECWVDESRDLRTEG